ncbi:MAG: hypothetical protein DRN14_05405, partial [Thermoplasmata archaeon]
IYVPKSDVIVRTPSFHLPSGDTYYVEVLEIQKAEHLPLVELRDKSHDSFSPFTVSAEGQICIYDLSSRQYRLVKISELAQLQDENLSVVIRLDDQITRLVPVTDIIIKPVQETAEAFTLVTQNGIWMANTQFIVTSTTFVSGNTDIDIQVVDVEDIVETELSSHIMDLQDLTIDDIMGT